MALDAATRAKFESAGLWQRFCKVREYLQARGETPAQAQQNAVIEMEMVIHGHESVTERELGAIISAKNPLKTLFANKPKSSVLDNYKWVAANLIYEECDLDLALCPSAEALGLYRWAKEDRKEFYSMYKNLLPTKQQVEQAEKSRDDGRYVLDKIEELRRSRGIVRAGAEDAGREP